VGLLVLVGGGVFWQLWPAEQRATSTLVVLPDASGVEVASYYDTLSSGQIATTFAEIVGLRAADGAPSGVTVDVDVVPETSLIKVTATAGDVATAEAEANAALERARPYFDQLSAPYDLSTVQSAEGTAEPTGLTPALLAGVVAGLAVIAGLAAYVAVRGLQQARASTTAPKRAAEVVDGPTPAQQLPTVSVRTEGGMADAPTDGRVPVGPLSSRPAR
jgi:hypothetical protein